MCPRPRLVEFIIKSKSLQFITTGLLGGVYAFAKLYICVTDVVPEGAPSHCSTSAPGTHPTFLFEIILVAVRTALVWITFLLIRNFDALLTWKRQVRASSLTVSPL